MSQPPGRSPIQIAVTPRFARRCRKLSLDQQRALARALRLFVQDPHDPRLATHKLQGEHADHWAISFGYDARVIFKWEDGVAVLLDVGTHDEVYG